MMFKAEKILVCDDQPRLRKLLVNAIRNFSGKYEVVEAANGVVAEQMIKSQQFSAIFMDVEMPEQDGFTTIEHLRSGNWATGVPVILCTGCNGEEDFNRGRQLEADYYLLKPFDLDEVESILKEVDRKNVVDAVRIPMV